MGTSLMLREAVVAGRDSRAQHEHSSVANRPFQAGHSKAQQAQHGYSSGERTIHARRLQVCHKVAAAAVEPLLALLHHKHHAGGAALLGEGDGQVAAVVQPGLDGLVAGLVGAGRPAVLQQR